MKFTRIITNTLGTAMLAGALMLAPQTAEARVFISVGFAPPAIPVYEQPICPGDGYIWTPGYWQYTDDGYEWIDGQWVLAPYTGALWTPGYWGYGGSGYFWNAGYWGPTVGYYGGINYGFGYFGVGFYGGYWNHNYFFYNREYNHFGGRFTSVNVYSRHIDGFDGRPGGSSFARGVGNDHRGGTFNTAGRGGFGQNDGRGNFSGTSNGIRVANGSDLRGAYGGVNDRNGSFANNNRQSFNQPGQARPGGAYGNGFNNGGRGQAVNPGSSFRPGQGGNPGGFGGAQPRGNSGGGQPAPRANFGGGGHAAPSGGGGAPHGGGGGGGNHGGPHH
jgi:WXXGXW repeat (2 copies)